MLCYFTLFFRQIFIAHSVWENQMLAFTFSKNLDFKILVIHRKSLFLNAFSVL